MNSSPEPLGKDKSVKAIAQFIGGKLLGDGEHQVQGVCAFDEPQNGCISFVQRWSEEILEVLKSDSPLSALLIPDSVEAPTQSSLPLIQVAHPFAALVKLVPVFSKALEIPEGISPQAVIDPTASIGSNVSIGPFSWIGARARIGDGTRILSHAAIYPHAQIGRGALIHSHAVVREHCSIADQGVVQNGAVIGADGFGYLPDPEIGLRTVPQIGRVEIGNRVDIGANTCIDRATLGTTVIGDGTKLDNLVQVGHNTKIGEFSILCGQAGIAGSCRIGSGVTIGGNVGIADHIRIADGCRVAGKSGVTNDLKVKGDYAGFPAISAQDWRRAQVALRSLPKLKRELKRAMKK